MSDSADHQGRQAGEFTEEEARVHQAGFKIIFDGMEKGLGFDEACAGLEVIDPGMRKIVIDDYLKVTIAERHFQKGEPLEDVAGSLRISPERLAATKEDMLREIRKAAVDVYRKESSDSGFDMEDVSGEPPGDTGSN
jgi:hypothetical protein